jgi:hypothetical protein
MLSQWLLIMVSYDEPLVVNHGLFKVLKAVNHGVVY